MLFWRTEYWRRRRHCFNSTQSWKTWIFVIRDCEASAVIYDSQTLPSSQAVEGDGGSDLLRLNVDQLTGDEPATEELETCPRSPADEALWVYSSGSTSRPKGIVHTHRSIIDCCAFHSDTLGVAEGDLVFCTSKLSFAYALANGLLAPLRLGAAVYLHPDWITPDALCSVLDNPKAPGRIFGTKHLSQSAEPNAGRSGEIVFNSGPLRIGGVSICPQKFDFDGKR